MRFFDDLIKSTDDISGVRDARDERLQKFASVNTSLHDEYFSPPKQTSNIAGVRSTSKATIPSDPEVEAHSHNSHLSLDKDDVLRSEIQKRTNKIQDTIQPWNPDLIECALSSGRFVRIWSRTLGRWCVWVRDEEGKSLASRRFPETPVFTLAELKILVEAQCSSNHLKCISEVRAILGNECKIQLEGSQDERSEN